MANPSNDVYADIAELYRMVEALSTAPQMPPMVRGSFGGVSDPNGQTGARFMILDGDGHIIYDAKGDVKGQSFPIVHSAWRRADDFLATTSSTWVTMYKCYFEMPNTEGVKISLSAQTGVGTTGEIRIRESYSGDTTGTIAMSSGFNNFVRFEWLPPSMAVGWNDPHGRHTVEFHIEMRRTGGAGNCVAQAPLPLIWHGQEWGHGDSNGDPTIL